GEIRRAHSRGDGEKNRHDDERRLRESEPERGAEKWRGARRRERGREYALKKRTGFAFTRARMQHAMHERLREDNFENAEEIEREDEHDHAQKQNEIRIGELRGPGDLMTGGLEPDEQQREPDEPNENAEHECDAVAHDRLSILPGVFDETENFERDHRQDARH